MSHLADGVDAREHDQFGQDLVGRAGALDPDPQDRVGALDPQGGGIFQIDIFIDLAEFGADVLEQAPDAVKILFTHPFHI